MELLTQFIHHLLHLDVYLNELVKQYGLWTYLLLFVIVFCETGLVVTPFLPGDSLMFAVGALAASENAQLHLGFIVILLPAAAILGNTSNYWIGRYIGPKVFQSKSRFLKREYLERTHKFYEKYGSKTVILAQFAPIIRTFSPFLAGVGSMTYPKFILFNIVGAFAWVLIFTLAGYFFGNLEIVKKNFTLVIMAIIVISLIPTGLEVLKARREGKAQG